MDVCRRVYFCAKVVCGYSSIQLLPKAASGHNTCALQMILDLKLIDQSNLVYSFQERKCIAE
eukprot:m.91710 g.91710  ORF g.91710 m.91710 type:complete len:62 (+) comp12957_c0_seq4:1644-1829(+)